MGISVLKTLTEAEFLKPRVLLGEENSFLAHMLPCQMKIKITCHPSAASYLSIHPEKHHGFPLHLMTPVDMSCMFSHAQGCRDSQVRVMIMTQ